jgi:hypothetical protein
MICNADKLDYNRLVVDMIFVDVAVILNKFPNSSTTWQKIFQRMR